MSIAVTGASGKLGQLVVQGLVDKLGATNVVALARNPKSVSFAPGVQVREFDYNKPDSLTKALQGVSKILLISGNELDRRYDQHKAVVDASKEAGVKFLAYTSILRSPTSTLKVTDDHKTSEAYIQQSGLQYCFLRNGWYIENIGDSIAPVVQYGALLTGSGEGKISAASRADYAAAAVEVLTSSGQIEKEYELAGDDFYTAESMARVISAASNKQIQVVNLPESAYAEKLESFGLPKPVAAIIADAEAKSADGALFDDSKSLSRLIGRPTESYKDVITKAVQKLL